MVQTDASTVLFYDRTRAELRAAYFDRTPRGKYDFGVDGTPLATNVGRFYQSAFTDSRLDGLYGSGYGLAFSWFDRDRGGLIFNDGYAL